MKVNMNKIKEALSHEKLVIFVGAGISKNSNVPTWGHIVRQFARELDYTQCLSCHFKNDTCEQTCRHKHYFSTDEYIKIPQYFYSQDTSENHENYYKILKNAFYKDYKPNILNDLIASLNPEHIITTNYDHLLDNYQYEVITSDRDLLKAKSNHYLIKMHGDIDDIEHIVFKEDDYLRYSHTHSLIELYIKSLLIDHTFLFVGYSLNDYNLKTFLSWIDYLGHEKKVKENMHANYLITNDIFPNQDYLISYYEQKNIQVINLNNLDERLINESKKVPLEEEIGRKTYICLKHLKQG
ncbi:MAG: SIR2 family protein [Bacilli bacterium]|nr:SIR2 family protein [Bacilli bacterium]